MTTPLRERKEITARAAKKKITCCHHLFYTGGKLCFSMLGVAANSKKWATYKHCIIPNKIKLHSKLQGKIQNAEPPSWSFISLWPPEWSCLDQTQNMPALIQDLGCRITVLYGMRKESIQAPQTYPKTLWRVKWTSRIIQDQMVLLQLYVWKVTVRKPERVFAPSG